MPVYDGPPGVVNHLRPVLLLKLLAVVALFLKKHYFFPDFPGNKVIIQKYYQQDLPDGVGSSDPVVVEHRQLEVHLAENA